MESRSGIPRTRSEQLEFSTARRSTDTENGAPYPTGARKSSLGRKIHIRKARSEQLKEELDALGIGTFPEESSMAALSRASSASMGFSFSLAGFTLPPEGMADLHGFPDENNNGDDLETGNSKKTATITEPTLPIFLKFWEVKYKVGVRGGGKGASEKEILKGITGSADPGEVLALMGPSGSGKTSLLNVLSGRVRQRNICGGSVTYNDLPFSKPLKSRVGFVTQDDVLFPHLTVRETLTYSALLRLPRTLTKQEKEERALHVISELGLERCLDTIIGGSFVRGVSGGERKRVCIGNEILINPSLLFLDEPTSGLDSTTALRIIQVLHGIAEAGKTVITTIHQPSSRLFQKFDKLILLGRGNLLYFGKAKDATGYFSTVGCSALIPMNPAEFLIDLANGNVTDITVPSELEDKVNTGSPRTETRNGKLSPSDVHDYLVEAFETRVADNEKKKLLKPSPIDDELKSKVLSKQREWGTSWTEQFSILFCRGLKERRHEYLSWMRVTQVFSTAIILGLLWWHSDVHTPKNLEDQAGLLFFIAVFWGFFPVFTAIFTFPQERAMLAKERSVDMYRLSAYFIARTSSDLPLDLILPVIFLGIVYFMAGLKLDVSAFFLTMVTVFLSIVAAEGLGLAIGATVMDIKKATTLASVTIMTFMLAGGFFVKKVPVFVSWVRYISFNYHTYKLLLRVQYGGIATSVNGVTIDSGAIEAGAMIAMVFLYRLLAYFSLRKMKLGNVS
ncbi:ABC transporter G family member 22 [Nymphaea thermarum]|nr:ABC transporter G family member 22 [Nymphaea thermarum]